MAQQLEIPTPPLDDNELALALYTKINMNQFPVNPEECYHCELADFFFLNQNHTTRVTTLIQGAFVAGQMFNRQHKSTLPPTPQIVRDLEQHPLRSEFLQAIENYLAEHCTMNTF